MLEDSFDTSGGYGDASTESIINKIIGSSFENAQIGNGANPNEFTLYLNEPGNWCGYEILGWHTPVIKIGVDKNGEYKILSRVVLAG